MNGLSIGAFMRAALYTAAAMFAVSKANSMAPAIARLVKGS